LLPLIAERHLVDSARTLLTTVANQSNLILWTPHPDGLTVIT
jgi:hypothetical protein